MLIPRHDEIRVPALEMLKYYGILKLKDFWVFSKGEFVFADLNINLESVEPYDDAMVDHTSEEHLDQAKVERIISDFLFTGRMATEDEILEALNKQPSVLQPESVSTRITNKIEGFIQTFLSGCREWDTNGCKFW